LTIPTSQVAGSRPGPANRSGNLPCLCEFAGRAGRTECGR
jgi:hypothetical protein